MKHKRKFFLFSFLFLIILFIVTHFSMRIFKTKCLFSEVQGVVLMKGSPVEGVEIERFYDWQNNDRSKREIVTSDSAGKFYFDSVYDNSLFTTLLPSQPLITQEIHIRHEGKEYEAYLHMKDNYDNNGELDGKKLSFVCDLDTEPSRDGGFYGICTLGK